MALLSTSPPIASGHSPTQPDTSPTRPTPSSLNSLLNQGMPLADAKNFKEKCAKCFAALNPNTVSLRCNVCTKGFHQKCSTGLKASTRDNQWKCRKCTKLQQNRVAASINCHLPGPKNSTPPQPLPVAFRNKLKIYQWDADGIRPEFAELRDRLINSMWTFWLPRRGNYEKKIKLHSSKVTLLSERTVRKEATSLEVVFYFSFELT